MLSKYVKSMIYFFQKKKVIRQTYWLSSAVVHIDSNSTVVKARILNNNYVGENPIFLLVFINHPIRIPIFVQSHNPRPGCRPSNRDKILKMCLFSN